jgi:hypothetical protein
MAKPVIGSEEEYPKYRFEMICFSGERLQNLRRMAITQ